MLTPVFSCSQDDRFVLVRILLSAICKVTDAVFDINATQFTFYCRPYYLRLKFNERLTEDKGERATYEVETNTLVVYLPKETTGQLFTQLDNPAYLLATEKQRVQLLQVLHSDDGSSGAAHNTKNEEEVNDDDDDDEYVQTVPNAMQGDASATQPLLGTTKASTRQEENSEEAVVVHYGFGDFFSGLFAKVDPDLIQDMIDLPDPEHTTPQERTQIRLQRENEHFDEDTLLTCFADEDGEVARLLRYVPPHVRDFEAALRESGVAWTCKAAMRTPTTAQAITTSSTAAEMSTPVVNTTLHAHCDDALEEEETAPLPGQAAAVEVWCGNVGSFGVQGRIHAEAERVVVTNGETHKGGEVEVDTMAHFSDNETKEKAKEEDTLLEEQSPLVVAETDSSPPVQLSGQSHPLRLAIPRHRPRLQLTVDENAALIHMRLPRLLFPPRPEAVVALTLDLLFAEAYDDIVTEGTGCSESLWNLCTLSPALSYLDPATNIYDACVYFARRALIYPLHRHFALVQRVFALVGTRLLLGRLYVVRALLRVRDILAHAEHKHILATLFLDPLIGYWMNQSTADAMLAQAALDCHVHVTRTRPERTTVTSSGTMSGCGDGPMALLLHPSTRTLQPLTLLTLGLPLS